MRWVPVSIFVGVALLAVVPLLTRNPDSISAGDGYLGGPSGGGHGYGVKRYDFASLKQDAAIIVVGDVIRLVGTYGFPDLPDINTIFEFNVVQYVKGTGPGVIYVAEKGGVMGGVTDPGIRGDPLLTVAARHVLFLSNNWTCGDPSSPRCNLPPTPLEVTFHPLGGAQGKFLVLGDFVFGFKTLYPDENFAFLVDANHVPLDEFLSRISKA